MKEQLISLETAKLAKEKGFKTSYHSYYFEDGEFREHKIETSNGYYGDIVIYEQEEFYGNWNDAFLTAKNGNRCFGCNKSQGYFETYTAPSQSLLQKWLRETHQLHLEIQVQDYVETPKFYWNIFGTYKNNKMIRCIANSPREDYVSYEEALEAGLQKALSYI